MIYNLSSQPVNRHRHAIIHIREIIPSIRIAERIGGLPLARFRAVVAEEKGIARRRLSRAPHAITRRCRRFALREVITCLGVNPCPRRLVEDPPTFPPQLLS